jgi:hypothetical protein
MRPGDAYGCGQAPELHELLIIRRGWSIERYGRFIADAMIAALLPS